MDQPKKGVRVRQEKMRTSSPRRPTSPVIGSVINVCVVTLLPVVPVIVIDVAIACWTTGCTATIAVVDDQVFGDPDIL